MFSSFWGSSAQQTGKWRTVTPLKTRYPTWNPICIGKSIWISSRYDDGEKGMIEFCCTSNSIKQIIPYPHGFRPDYHSVCGLDGNDIMIIDGRNGKMRTFNVIIKKYGPEITIPKLGWYVSAIMIRGYLHIMHGSWNNNSKYLVYSIADETLSEFKGNHQSPKTKNVTITKGPDDTFYKFGGHDWINKQYLDSFYVGRLQHDDPSKPIQWKKNDHFTLKKPLYGPSYIHYNHWIIIFGGWTSENTVDDIYILDVRSKKGWIQSPIKCPMKSRFVGVLDHQQRVHLFTVWNDSNQHYCMALNKLIPDLAISPMKQSATMKKQRQIQQHDDDEKRDDEMTDTAKLRNINRVLRATNESLQNEVERLGTANGALRVEMEMDKKKAMERIEALESEQTKLLKEKRESMVEVEALKKTNAEMKELHEVKVKEMKEQMVVKEEEQRLLIDDMMAENKRMSDQIAVHEEEQKEAQMKIAELEDKVKEFQMKALDPSKFMEWDWNLIHLWIMGLEGGKFRRYSVVLKEALSASEFTGEDLLSVNPMMIRMWGIKDKKESKSLNKHIQKLVAQYQSCAVEVAKEAVDEGAATAFM